MYKGGANDNLEMQLEDKPSESTLPLDLSITHIVSFHLRLVVTCSERLFFLRLTSGNAQTLAPFSRLSLRIPLPLRPFDSLALPSLRRMNSSFVNYT